MAETTTPNPKSSKQSIFWLHKLVAVSFLLCALVGQSEQAFSQSSATPGASQLRAPRDGSHDFDFNLGVWHTHIRRVLDPFASQPSFMELDGTVTTRKVWGGRAHLEEIEADGPKGHWEGLSLFLYNPESHQWSQSFLNSQTPSLSPMVGSFKDGRGELFQQDTFHGKSILVRATWSVTSPNEHRYQEDFSSDGGKTWALYFIATKTRLQPESTSDVAAGAEPVSSAPEGHEFDFDLGTWKTHSTRLLHPLTGSTTWADLDGITVVKKVWNGRGNLAEYKADGPSGGVQLLSLRWYNPATHEWNLDFATPSVGTLGIPGVGTFKNGRGDFYDYEVINGKSVLVRFSIWEIGADSAQSEQAFSEDGGKTWEVNWINRYTRVKGS